MHSYLDKRGGGRFKLAGTDNFLFHLEPIGFADAQIEVLAFNVVMIPAFATEMVCCSY
jgi:hypothetical protein